MTEAKPEDMLAWLKPGQRIYLQGGPAECQTFIDLLKANPGAAKGIELWSCLIPGINTFDYTALPDGPTLVTFMASHTLDASAASGRTRIDAMPYSEIGARLASTDFDLAILHTAAPGANGVCSFGIGCDAPGIAWPRAEKRIAFLNRAMPAIPDSDAIPVDRLDLAIDIDAPLLSPPPERARSETLAAIAQHAAALIPDGAVIQSGIGEAPGAVVAALASRKRLRVHSGIVTPDYCMLAEAGALDMDAEHIAGIAWGDPGFYRWLGEEGLFSFRSIFDTHDRSRLSATPNFMSIGSALEVDLDGALNLEWRGDRRVSSVGGAPDYIHSASASPGGLAIIVLPSTATSGASRIVARLANPSIRPTRLAVVTEYGAVRLDGLSAEARAMALIGIAAPQHRDTLARHAS
jgi:acyl-CoA hydrolase